MSRPFSFPSALDILFCGTVALALVAFAVRGQGSFRSTPGGIFMLLILLTIGLGILWILDKTR